MSGGFSADLAMFIPLLPMLTFPIILIVGQLFKGEEWWIKLKEGGLISLAAMGSVLIISLLLVYDYIGGLHGEHASDNVIDKVGDWITFDFLSNSSEPMISKAFGLGIYVDHITLMLLFVASFLCFLINWFSIGYMNTDPINENRNHRFYAAFLLFCSGMLGMTLADNFLWLFMFWEVMGLCSYLLIGFYWERPSAASAAKKAFLTTRVGDVFLMVGLVILWNIYGSLDFATIFDWNYIANPVDTGLLHIGLLMMFIGAVGKSAQFPLHVWLPDAMEGPTPVSALIHAATMVNAGLYLVARMFPIFAAGDLSGELTELAILITWIGGITAFMAAAIAFVQMDIKKVLAYSTMSQLAYIFTGLGVALWFANADFEGHMALAYFALGASLFHLFNHAMAKGMLFMASGSVIHEMHHAHHHLHHHDDHDDDHHEDHFDAQDMSNMGGLASKMPITATAMAIGSMSIIGIPLIGGFWSKEGIVAKTWKAALHDGGGMLLVPAILILITAGMTGFYMSRMWFMTFAGKTKTDVAKGVHEETPWIKTPLVLLSCVSMLAIVFASMHFVDWVSENHSFKISGFIHNVIHELEHAFLPKETSIRLIGWTTILLSAIIGPVLAMSLYGGKLDDGEQSNPLIHWLVILSDKCKERYNFDNSAWADSPVANALRRRLYFDEWYDWLMLKIFVPFAFFIAWFDKRGVDGVVKGIEKTSSTSSSWIRTLTTGSARDYIMMVALGTLVIFVLIGGAL